MEDGLPVLHLFFTGMKNVLRAPAMGFGLPVWELIFLFLEDGFWDVSGWPKSSSPADRALGSRISCYVHVWLRKELCGPTGVNMERA
jgi:hypothetical protein